LWLSSAAEVKSTQMKILRPIVNETSSRSGRAKGVYRRNPMPFHAAKNDSRTLIPQRPFALQVEPCPETCSNGAAALLRCIQMRRDGSCFGKLFRENQKHHGDQSHDVGVDISLFTAVQTRPPSTFTYAALRRYAHSDSHLLFHSLR
jgi:hypothetical protein